VTENLPQINGSRVLKASWLAMVAVGAMLSAWPIADAGAVDWQLNRSISSQVNFSDNVDLDPDAQAKSSITPSTSFALNGTGRGGRVLFSTNSSLRVLGDTNDNRVSVNQAIRAFGRAELWTDRLFLDGNFSSTRELIDTSSSTSANNNGSKNNNNTNSVTTFILGPVLQHHFGKWADGQASYRHTEVFGTGTTDDARADSAQVVVTAGRGIPIWRPAVTVGWFNFDESSAAGDDIRQFSLQLANTIRINRNFGFLATIGYDDVDTPTSTRDLSGLFWSIGATGRLGPRTQFRFEIGRRYNTLGLVGTASYLLSSRLTLNLNASQDVGTGLQRAGTQVQRLTVSNSQGVLTGTNGLPPGFIRSDLNTGISTSQNIGLGLVGTYGRNSVNLGISATRRDFNVGSENLRSARASITRQVSLPISLTLGGFYRYVDDQTGVDTHAFGASLNLNYRLGSQTTLFVGVSRTDRFAKDIREEFSENSATIGGRISF
jgi:uncharacterized protein (PEP-CTERM system associated)